MKNKSKYKVLVGKKAYILNVDVDLIDGAEFFDEESLLVEQKKIAVQILLEAKKFDVDVFNFSMNVVGERASTIAKKIPITPAYLSKVRAKDSDMSPALWKLFRLVMVTILGNQLGLKDGLNIEDIILSDMAS